MRREFASICLVLSLPIVFGFSAFQRPFVRSSTSLDATENNNEVNEELSSRRRFLGALAGSACLLPALVVRADEDSPDLTTQLFNPDGSLKGEVEEAKSKAVTISWSAPSNGNDRYAINVDGKDTVAATESGSEIRLSYKIPEKWQQKEGGYFDKSSSDFSKACERIVVYRAPGKVSSERLAKATTIGLAEALYVTDDLKILQGADLISGRTRKQGDIKFYDFDMAVAPKTCADSKENLGLGFCPFDSIYLLSAAVYDDTLYVMALECDKSEWKVASSDLKRVRSSFAFDIV